MSAIEVVDTIFGADADQLKTVLTVRLRRVGDLVMWDNRCTMHRGTAFDDLRWPRDLMRATCSDRPDAFGRPEDERQLAAQH